MAGDALNCSRGLARDRFRRQPRIPVNEAEYVAAYCRRTGRDRVAEWDFYMVYSLFRIAAILQGIAKRAIEGTAANASEARRRGRPPRAPASPNRPGRSRARCKASAARVSLRRVRGAIAVLARAMAELVIAEAERLCRAALG